jgi:hypothetical protein
MQIIHEWYQQLTPRQLWPMALKDALKKSRHHRMADILERIVASADPIEKVLARHEDREGLSSKSALIQMPRMQSLNRAHATSHVPPGREGIR